MPRGFVHLHVHSEYSLLDGACRVTELARRAVEYGMPAVSITDHGVMYGVMDFYKVCRDAGVNPIIGCEIYVAPRRHTDKEPKIDDANHHLVLLVENEAGYRNLVRLVSIASLDGFYYKPRVDKELLARHSEGLIALTACLGGEIPGSLLRGDLAAARRAVGEYRDIFGMDRLFLELQDHGLPEQRQVNPRLVSLARELDIGLVATNDVHYLTAADARAHDVLICIQTGRTVHDENRMKYPGGQFYFKSAAEMESLFGEVPEALDNTVAIAERCRVDFEFGRVMLPDYRVPEGHDPSSYLRHICFERLPSRYPDMDEAVLEKVRRGGRDDLKALPAASEQERSVLERLEYELSVIGEMGYPGYFLIVSDFIEHARHEGIAVGPGRGSAAGSLVAYTLGITGIDPLRYHLLFERFLNPERVSMPDMDIDFDDRRRGEVIDYVRRKYGEERVSQIITFGHMLARAVVRDVGRALGIPYGEVDRIAKMVPVTPKITLDKALEQSSELAEAYRERPEVRELIDLARRLEGLPRHASVHAAGVVIARDPLMDHVPLQKMNDGTVVTQFPMNVLDELGLLKFDFLGLRTLSLIEGATGMVRWIAGEELDPYDLPQDDGKTYELLGQGRTGGVFQLESGGMRDMLRELKPTSIEDIVAAVALYRPGPMDNIPEFIRSKHQGNIRYPHPLLEPILKDTYGIMVYQEQIMQVASVMAGFSLGQADILRRAVGKKKKKELAAQREVFVKGCVDQGHPKKLAQELYDLIVKFADYGFNRCLPGDVTIFDRDTGELVSIRDIVERGRRPAVAGLGEDGNLRRGRITAAFANGKKPVYRLQTASGRTIRATATHRFLCFDGWRPLGDIRMGDRIAVPRILPVAADKRWPYYKLALLGYVLAEGNTCHPCSFYYYTRDERELVDYLRVLEQFENTEGRVDRSKSAMAVYAKRRDRTRPSAAVTWLKGLGMWGRKATEKVFPDEVFGLHPEDVEVVLGKMWVGDGCIDPDKYTTYYATSSAMLVRQVQHLLLRLGILNTIHEKAFKYRGGIRTGYTVSINGFDNLRRFAGTVGRHLVGASAEKTERLIRNYGRSVRQSGQVIARGTKDTVPTEILAIVRREVALAGLTPIEVAATCGVSPRLFSADARKKGFRRETLAWIAQVLGSRELARHASSDVFWDTVAAVEPEGEEETYDLTVDEDHNFVANDIIVHNSHAAAYGLLAYITAYLKANHPAPFMAALLTSVMDNSDKVAEYIRECGSMGIPVLPPDINESLAYFTVVGGRIRFGLVAVKNVGLGAVESIVSARREGGPFRSLLDFLIRVDIRQLNRRAVESLIKAGALDSLGARRAQLLEGLEVAMQRAQSTVEHRNSGQVSLFDVAAVVEGAVEPEMTLPEVDEFPLRRILAMEKEILGLYLSGHPLEGREKELADLAGVAVADLAGITEGASVTVGGLITAVKSVLTRKGERMAFLTIQDLSDQVEVVVFPKVLQNCGDRIEEDAAVAVMGRVSWKDEAVTVVADKVVSLEEGSRRERLEASALHLRIGTTFDPLLRAKIRETLAGHPGKTPVYLRLPAGETILVNEGLWVSPELELERRLEGLLGSGNVFWLPEHPPTG